MGYQPVGNGGEFVLVNLAQQVEEIAKAHPFTFVVNFDNPETGLFQKLR